MDLYEESLELHAKNNGKLAVISKVAVKNRHDLAIAYTPGVAEPCRKIEEDKNLSFEYTCRGNMVAIVSDGTRVLGLGDIGPEAAMPVMEGKAVLFKTFGDVDAVPICIDAKDPDEFVNMVTRLQPSFAGINLEDISSPKCYEIEDRLKEICDIPVFHDDQHGTAIAACSAVVGALRFVKKDLKDAKIIMHGYGAAGTAIARLLLALGAGDVIITTRVGAVDSKYPRKMDKVQEYLQGVTNKHDEHGMLEDVAKGADVLIGASGPNLFTEEVIGNMNENPIVFALANPVPEITYENALKFGAAVAGTGRSDTPNQVNNVTVFPGIFRGALDCRATAITEDMKVAAVYAISNLIADEDLKADYVVPDAFDERVIPAVAAAVAKVAMETGVARVKVDPKAVYENTLKRVNLKNK
jgi:malate dehydrogenase (oxaloacetate-decarboxylating)